MNPIDLREQLDRTTQAPIRVDAFSALILLRYRIGMKRYVFAAFLLSMGCDADGMGPPTFETTATQCRDGLDNDQDGLTDCQDPECSAHAWCEGVMTDSGPPPPPPVDAGPPRDGGDPCSEPMDVVFVIDVSTSMTDEIDSIRRGIDSVWTASLGLTDNSQFSLVVFVDDVATVNGCAPFATIEAMQTELMRWQTFAASNDQPGGSPVSNSDCPENSLDALHAAATTCPWRAGSYRMLIHVTDDTFEERPYRLSSDFTGGGGVPVQHTYAETVAALVGNQVRVGAFAAPGAGEECGAGSSPDVGRGFSDPFLGMESIPAATGGHAWSIRDVRAGSLNMAEAINDFTASEYCTLF